MCNDCLEQCAVGWLSSIPVGSYFLPVQQRRSIIQTSSFFSFFFYCFCVFVREATIVLCNVNIYILLAL
jgi:hypothetical protein